MKNYWLNKVEEMDIIDLRKCFRRTKTEDLQVIVNLALEVQADRLLGEGEDAEEVASMMTYWCRTIIRDHLDIVEENDE